ncbi:nodulation protein NfeD [Candidatus Bathyarchaeota archaeon]|nr:MAG: nodulation protein NfeD [Candidatus Bathyarchaeota archaeon]
MLFQTPIRRRAEFATRWKAAFEGVGLSQPVLSFSSRRFGLDRGSKTREVTGLIILVLAIFLVLQSFPTYLAVAASQVYVASWDGPIDPGAQDFVASSISDARSIGATTFILVLNTFGGSGNNMDNIISTISSYQTDGNTVITLVAPTATHAFSAGTFIAEASNKIYMVRGTVIGSATPVLPPFSDPSELRKDIDAFSKYMQTITRYWGRNDTATALMVTNGTSYTDADAARLGVINGTLAGPSVRNALAQLPAPYTITDPNIEIHSSGIRSAAIEILSDPTLAAVLFLLGVAAILIDLFHPTLVLTVIGGTALVLSLFGLGLFGVSLVSLVLMLVGALFIFLEVKIHHGVSALIGVAIFIVGFLLIFRLPPSPPIQGQPTGLLAPIAFITYVLLGLLSGGVVLGSLYLYKVRETLMHQPLAINPKSIIGKEGFLTTDLKAGGFATANISAEDYTVTSTSDVPKGTRVVVIDVQGLKLIVERKKEA